MWLGESPVYISVYHIFLKIFIYVFGRYLKLIKKPEPDATGIKFKLKQKSYKNSNISYGVIVEMVRFHFFVQLLLIIVWPMHYET